MFSEAEQIHLQSFLTDLEKGDSKNANEESSNSSKRKKEKKRMKPYTKKDNSKSRSPSTTSNDGIDSIITKSGRARKPPHELLSEDQKKANHIVSEQKRRANIRIGFDQLVDMVPALDSCHRSESLILQKYYIRELIKDKDQLKERARELQSVLGEVPDDDSSEGEIDYYR